LAPVAAKAVLASANAHKLDELREGLPGWQLSALESSEWPDETGETYEENARIKARFGREHAPADAWVLGEDSGIEVDALGGGPGVRSARWAPQGDQADALVERLAGEDDRRARMVTVIVAVAPSGDEIRVRGVLEGELARERRGDSGFGYDPIFIPDGYDRTVAELGDDWKRAHSHRARAAHALLEALRSGGAS
jgi:XTP/dITP diphosphohydrolase